MSATVEMPPTFTPQIGSTLKRMSAELSEGPGSLVSQICDAIMEDLDGLCEHKKQSGEKDPKIPNTTFSWRTGDSDEFKGTYVGFGLGKSWLNLGFLEEPVAAMLRERLKKGLIKAAQDEPSSVDTMLGTVHCEGDCYMTPHGAYMLSHTYTWFIKKRVE